MSTRTRNALAAFDLQDPTHLSAQLDDEMAQRAALIVVFEPMHVSYMRKKHPAAAGRVASLPRIARDLASGPLQTLHNRVERLQLGSQAFEDWEEVVDPAGGDLPEFLAAAQQIDPLIDQLIATVGTPDASS